MQWQDYCFCHNFVIELTQQKLIDINDNIQNLVKTYELNHIFNDIINMNQFFNLKKNLRGGMEISPFPFPWVSFPPG